MASALIASSRPPTRQSRAFAVAGVVAACRSGHLDLGDAEDRLQRIYAAATYADLYRATSGLPPPLAPLVLVG